MSKIKAFIQDDKNLGRILFYLTFISFISAAFYFSHNIYRHSDGANISFMGYDIAQGNILLKNWHLSTQSFFFTDVLLHGILALFIQNLSVLAETAGIVIAFICCFSSYLLYKQLAREHNNRLIFLTSFLVLFYAIPEIVMSPNHNMTIAYCLLAAVAYYNQNNTLRNKIIFMVFSSFAVASDSYSLAFLVLPIIAETIIKYFMLKEFNPKVFLLAIPICFMLIFSLLVNKFGFYLPGVEIWFVKAENFSQNFYLYFFGAFSRMDAWFWGEKLSLAVLPKLFFAVILGGYVISHIWAALKYKTYNPILIFVVLSSLFVSLVFLLTTFPVDIGSSRYLYGIFYNGMILLAVMGSLYVKNHKVILTCCLGILIFCNGYIYNSAFRSDTLLKNEVKMIKNLNKFLENKGLKNGYGSFWNATSVGLQSKKIFVAGITAENKIIKPFLWLTNENWYNRPAEFVVLNPKKERHGITEEAVSSFFGQPKEKHQVGDYQVWIYNYDLSQKFLSYSYQGADLLHGISTAKIKNGKVLVTENDGTGHVTYGPYVKLKPGKYSVSLSYRLSANGQAEWDIVYDGGKKSLFRQTLPIGQTKANYEFVLEKTVHDFEVRTFYKGRGNFTVKAVSINRNN